MDPNINKKITVIDMDSMRIYYPPYQNYFEDISDIEKNHSGTENRR